MVEISNAPIISSEVIDSAWIYLQMIPLILHSQTPSKYLPHSYNTKLEVDSAVLSVLVSFVGESRELGGNKMYLF